MHIFCTLLEMHKVVGSPLFTVLTTGRWLSNLFNHYNAFVNLKIRVERRHVKHVLDLIYKSEPHT